MTHNLKTTLLYFNCSLQFVKHLIKNYLKATLFMSMKRICYWNTWKQLFLELFFTFCYQNRGYNTSQFSYKTHINLNHFEKNSLLLNFQFSLPRGSRSFFDLTNLFFEVLCPLPKHLKIVLYILLPKQIMIAFLKIIIILFTNFNLR